MQPRGTTDIERRTGVALWRQIADRIRSSIASGLGGADGKLPPETELAALFGVNRHTVRAAISALGREGVLRAEQGRGTFVVKSRRLSYPIGRRTRFSAGLEGQALDRRGELLETAVEPAAKAVADALQLAEGSKVVRLESLSRADGVPVSRASSWFEAGRFSGIGAEYARTGSMTAALSACGIEDYLRRWTTIDARHAGADDRRDLALSPGAIVLIARAVNTDTAGRPIQYSVTRFAADRVELRVDGAPDNP